MSTQETGRGHQLHHSAPSSSHSRSCTGSLLSEFIDYDMMQEKACIIYQRSLLLKHMYPDHGHTHIVTSAEAWEEAVGTGFTFVPRQPDISWKVSCSYREHSSSHPASFKIHTAGIHWRNEVLQHIRTAVIPSFNLELFSNLAHRKEAAKSLGYDGTFLFKDVTLNPDGTLATLPTGVSSFNSH